MTKSPVRVQDNADGTKTVFYFGSMIGWIQPYQSRVGVELFRARTTQGHIRHFEHLDLATKFLTDHGV